MFVMSRVQISIEDLTVSVNNYPRRFMLEKSKKRVVLNGITASFQPGRFTAILGPSGAGKTILLNVLAGRIASVTGTIIEKGNIWANNMNIVDERFLSTITSFVEQHDILYPTMKVQEAFRASKNLRMPHEREHQIIDQTIESLGLSKIKTSKIGSASQRTVSGGELKRISIGTELLTTNPILLLDEPTSGLDSFAALSVSKLLHDLAVNTDKTVVATIHTPSSQMLQYFHDALIMAEGRVLYFGPARDLVNYFQSTFNVTCPRYVNPADFVFLEIIHINQEIISGAAYDKRRVISMCQRYQRTVWHQRLIKIISSPPPDKIRKEMTYYIAPFWKQLWFLIKRQGIGLYRDPSVVFIRLTQTLVLGVFIALVYLNVTQESASASIVFFNIEGALFLVAINQAFTSLNNTLYAFAGERDVFQREYFNHYYSLPAYYISKVIVELPFTIIFTVLVALIVYWIIGFRPGFDHFLLFTLFLILIASSTFALGLFAASLFKNPEASLALGVLFLLPLVIYGGLFVSAANSPEWLAWLQWISPIQYGYTGLLQNELQDRVIQGSNGNDELQRLGASQRLPIGVNIVLLVVIIIVLLLLAFIGLAHRINTTNLSHHQTRQVVQNTLNR